MNSLIVDGSTASFAFFFVGDLKALHSNTGAGSAAFAYQFMCAQLPKPRLIYLLLAEQKLISTAWIDPRPALRIKWCILVTLRFRKETHKIYLG